MSLTPEVAYNGETWFLAHAIQALSMVRSLTSSVDPLELRDVNRIMTKAAHAGSYGTQLNVA